MCIDPFLLYKSRDEQLRSLHEQLPGIFARAFELFEQGNRAELAPHQHRVEINPRGAGMAVPRAQHTQLESVEPALTAAGGDQKRSFLCVVAEYRSRLCCLTL